MQLQRVRDEYFDAALILICQSLTTLWMLQDQAKIWDGLWPVRFFRSAPAWLVGVVTQLLGVLLFNRFVLW